jgi:PucR C-terminal helix-turn-helix domain
MLSSSADNVLSAKNCTFVIIVTASDVVRPWHQLPAEAAAALRPELPALAREIIAAIRDEVPGYARPLEGPFGRGLVAGVEEALRQFLDGIEAGGPMPRSRVYVALGRGEMRAGRSLDALLNAYRVGARVAWRRFSAAGVAGGLEPVTLYALAESIFAYIDELSAKSAEGYALEQSATQGERRAQRERLARLLVREPPADPLHVEELARAAGWRLPERLAALVAPEAERARLVSRLPAEAIVATVGDVVCALVPDPARHDRRAQLEEAAGTRHGVALGPVVLWTEAALSLSRARAVLELAADGAIPASGLLDAREHAAALLLRSDRRLAQELARDRLAPLRTLPDGPRGRLTETLAAWLACQGRLQAVASELHVHPQTVRYRLGQLRELLGDALDDADARFELELALRVDPG